MTPQDAAPVDAGEVQEHLRHLAGARASSSRSTGADAMSAPV
jgi:hypothetical protein